MSVLLIIVGVLVVLYGILRPEKRLPERLRPSSTLGGSAIFGLLCVAGAALLSGPAGDDEAASGPEADAVARPAPAPEADAWPGGEAARDSTFRALAGLLDAGRYPEAADRARALSVQPHAGDWADSLRALAWAAEEGALYARARRLPAADARANWLAYADLARRFPGSPRLGEYEAKRDAYERRLIAREAARYAPAPPEEAAAPPPEPPSPPSPESASGADPEAGPGPCCRVCVRGKPCGNTCIARDRECRSPPGCACQG